jgi:hypothetical protein
LGDHVASFTPETKAIVEEASGVRVGSSVAILLCLTSLFFSVFLSWQSFRAIEAASRIDGARSSKSQWPVLNGVLQKVTLDELLAEPRNARLWEVVSTQSSAQSAPAEALNETKMAIALSPAQAWPRMRATYLIAQSSQSDDVLNKAFADWHKVAPHDGSTQPWRLLLAAAYWDRISPANRSKALNDAEDVCVRSGRQRTQKLVGRGLPSASLAVSSRLGRMSRTCVVVAADLPPLIPQ